MPGTFANCSLYIFYNKNGMKLLLQDITYKLLTHISTHNRVLGNREIYIECIEDGSFLLSSKCAFLSVSKLKSVWKPAHIVLHRNSIFTVRARHLSQLCQYKKVIFSLSMTQRKKLGAI